MDDDNPDSLLFTRGVYRSSNNKGIKMSDFFLVVASMIILGGVAWICLISGWDSTKEK